MKPRFHLRDLFIATTWICMCLASWIYLANNSDWDQPRGFPEYHARFEGSTGVLALGGAFVAWSAIRGQHRLGLSFGILILMRLSYELMH